jgi:hypothetical protein
MAVPSLTNGKKLRIVAQSKHRRIAHAIFTSTSQPRKLLAIEINFLEKLDNYSGQVYVAKSRVL